MSFLPDNGRNGLLSFQSVLERFWGSRQVLGMASKSKSQLATVQIELLLAWCRTKKKILSSKIPRRGSYAFIHITLIGIMACFHKHGKIPATSQRICQASM